MSLSALIPYVRTKLEGLNYRELEGEFDETNVASTVLDKAFRLTPGELSSSESSSKDYEWTYPLEIEIFFKGYKKPSDAVDGAFIEVEKLMDEVFELKERFSIAGIRSISPSGIRFEPFSSDNDSIIKCKINLIAKIHIYNSKDCL